MYTSLGFHQLGFPASTIIAGHCAWHNDSPHANYHWCCQKFAVTKCWHPCHANLLIIQVHRTLAVHVTLPCCTSWLTAAGDPPAGHGIGHKLIRHFTDGRALRCRITPTAPGLLKSTAHPPSRKQSPVLHCYRPPPGRACLLGGCRLHGPPASSRFRGLKPT